MEFRMLGPLEVYERGHRLRLGGLRQRTVLALMLVEANRIVATNRLIDGVWGDEPPPEARNALQSYVSRLRRTLGAARIEGRPPGYALHVEPDEVDALRFESLVGRARERAGDPGDAIRLLGEALDLWRGPALADLADVAALQPELARLEDSRLAALERRIGLRLDLGEAEAVVPELEALVEEHSLRERLWAQLMVALYRSGRQADALAAYQRARRVLTDELGIEPSGDLSRLQSSILRHDPKLELAGGRLRGYRLVEKLGEGAFGVVYRAEQPDVGRDVAIKVIRPELADDPRFIRRFETEAQIVARIEHPHVVPLYDYWREPGAAYLVMRWLRGGSLRDVLRNGPLEPDVAARIFDQVAAGLAAAHRQGVVHRDVRPTNILLDDDGNGYLSDFGIAVESAGAGQRSLSRPSAYTAPEVDRGEEPTPRTDVYGLGVALHESLTGALPEHAPPARRPGGRVGETIRRATAADPGERFADASELSEALRHAFAAGGDADTETRRNPYKGLRAFEEADAEDFFGREALVERLVARFAVDDPACRFLAVVGASGSGKSSAVRAGLVPRLRHGARPGSERWFVTTMYPGAHPFEELEAALLRVAVNPPTSLIEQLERGELGLLRAIKRSLPDDGTELLLVVDQLEELFTLAGDERVQTAFLAALTAAVTDPRSRVRVVVTLRADFYDRPLAHGGIAELVRRATETVVPLAPDELERAVVEPAARAGVGVEPSLLAAIAGEAGDRVGALPLVQYALTELFERKADGLLTLASYREIGGIAGALARRAEALYDSLDEQGREAVRQLFLRLVALGEDAQSSRRRVPVSELRELELEPAAVSSAVELYARHRLLTFDRSSRTRVPTVEIAHEALLDEWSRLRGWAEREAEAVRLQRRLTQAADEWESSGRDDAFLLRGSRLEHYEDVAARGTFGLTHRERALLSASTAAREAEQAGEAARAAREAELERRSLRRLRGLAMAFGVGVLLALALSVFALDQREEARDQARVATARFLAAAAVANVDEDPERAVLLAIEAVEATARAGGRAVREAEEALHRSVQSLRIVDSAASAADLWEASVGKPLAASRGAVTSASGSMRAVRRGGALAITRAADGRTIRVLRARGAPLALSDDGRRVATVDRGVGVWGENGSRLLAVEGDPLAAAFSPDGARLAVSVVGAQEIWDVDTGTRLHSLTHDGHVRSLEFSRDGTLLATGGDDGSAHVWRVESGRELLRLPGAGSGIVTVAFTPDDRRVAAAAESGRGVLFDITPEGSREVATLATGALSIGYDEEGRTLVTASEEEGARVWDAESGVGHLVLSHTDDVFDAAFAPRGRRLATAARDGVTRIWDTQTGRRLAELRGHSAPVWGVAFTPDGRRLVSGAEDATVRVWDVAMGETVLVFRGHTDRVYDVAVTPDGQLVGSTGEDGLPRIWDIETGQVRSILRGHAGVVVQLDFSPDGRGVATAGFDGTARVWDVATGEELVRLSGHSGLVLDIAFSPDGKRVATASADGTTRLWDASSGRELLRLTSPTGAGSGRLAFTPDGTRLAVASFDDLLRILHLEPDELVTLAGERVTRDLTDDECRRYLSRPCETKAVDAGS